jgi:hypothetical protein
LRSGKGGGPALAGTTEVGLRTWHHVVLVRAGEAARIYLDGTLEIEGTARRGPAGGEPTSIGGARGSDASLEGKLDEVAIYDRALTADEIAAHYRESRSAAAR